jgi:hypothetical protein
MITHIDGKLYFEVTAIEDEFAIPILQAGRELVVDSLNETFNRIEEVGLREHHKEDIRDNMAYLDAFDKLIEYYGG